MRRRLVTLLVGVVCAAGLAACGVSEETPTVQASDEERARLAALVDAAPASEATRPNVLFIVIDTLRADHLGAYGSSRPTSPALDELARSAVRFERAYATAPWTQASIASMLSGLYPSGHGLMSVGKLADEVTTLPEVLREAGYATAAVVSHMLLHRSYGFDQGFESFKQVGLKDSHNVVSTEMVTRRATKALIKLSQQDSPFFLLVHYFDPHYNYIAHDDSDFAPPGAGRLRGGEEFPDLQAMIGDMSDAELRFLKDLYDEEVRHTDAGIGELLQVLEEYGEGEDTLVILTSDHGEEFLDHGGLGHTRSLHEELVRVPLIIRLPQAQEGRSSAGPRVVGTPVTLAALAPTVLDLAGVAEPDAGFHTSSFAPLLGLDSTTSEALAPPAIFVEVDFEPLLAKNADRTAHAKALIFEGFKIIRHDRTGGIEIYDLEADPGEHTNLAPERPELVARLQHELERHIEISREGAILSVPHPHSENEIEALRALGYAE